MKLQTGEPAEGSDVWIRAVTNTTHVRKTAIHHGQFKKWLGPPNEAGGSWKVELSGRLLSLVESISADANRRIGIQKDKLIADGKPVPSALQYCGVLYCIVDSVRQSTFASCDVLYDPQPDDTAHSNVVVRDKDMGEILTLIDEFLGMLTWVPNSSVQSNATLAPKA
ncbi:hypothetical protein [Hypericibacter sp.]|uniref:hypothetical protein n=1 Tax=Hypericibacter sp. TaxID=2705401 RepID=UPI003D6D2D3B